MAIGLPVGFAVVCRQFSRFVQAGLSAFATVVSAFASAVYSVKNRTIRSFTNSGNSSGSACPAF